MTNPRSAGGALRAAATGKPNTETSLAERPDNAQQLSRFLEKYKPQMALVLPKHVTPDRMARLVLTQFSKTPKLYESEPHTVAGAVITASTLGLEIGVQGQGFLVPYWNNKKRVTECQFIPGWRGLVDLANRSGRCTVFSGAVFEGDEFSYQLGARPDVLHRPGEEDDPAKLTHVYAVGWVNGAQWPVIEVWPIGKVRKHRDRYNKVGEQHYSFREWEMYARKVPLLQVLKYMPSSIELQRALDMAEASETGGRANIDLSGVIDLEEVPQGGDEGAQGGAEAGGNAPPPPPPAPRAAPAPQGGGGMSATLKELDAQLRAAKDADARAEVLDLGRSTLSDAEFEALKAVAQSLAKSAEAGGPAKAAPPKGGAR